MARSYWSAVYDAKEPLHSSPVLRKDIVKQTLSWAFGAFRSTSHMVAAPGVASTAAIGAAAQAAQAQAEKRTLWSPRSGLTDVYEDWKHETLLRIAKLGFNTFEELLAWLPPAQDGTAMAQTAAAGSVTRARAGEAATDSDEKFSARLAWYQRVNSEVFDIIEPSLTLDGTHKAKDRDTMRKFINGPVRDGRGLLEWALTWTAHSSMTCPPPMRSLWLRRTSVRTTCTRRCSQSRPASTVPSRVTMTLRAVP